MIKLLTRTHVYVVATFAFMGMLVLISDFLWPGIHLYALSLFVVMTTIFFILVILDLRTNVLLLESTNKVQFRKEIDNGFAQYEALLMLRDLIAGKPILPASRAWAASPDFLVHLYQLIEKERPKTIVELGSGLSTLICAYAIRNLDYEAVFHSIDHSGKYLEKTRDELQRHGLQSFVRLHEAPLQNIVIGGENVTWYKTSFIGELDTLDCLIIDGPPLAVGRHARYPALPLLEDLFSSSAVILMDDAGRADELEVIQRWLEDNPSLIRFDLHSEKGCALIRKC